MKRLVILQDEQLVIREIARAAKPVASFAAAGADGAARSDRRRTDPTRSRSMTRSGPPADR